MMRRIRSQRHRRAMAEINVVPYIDVMLVLLVIFMITAPLLSQGVKINLPHAAAKPLVTQQNTPIIVSVDTQGRYFLNIANNPNKPISPQTLATRIAAELQLATQQGQKRLVLIKGDQAANYGKVVGAMVLLQHAGVANVGLMTQTMKQPLAKNKSG